VEPKTYVAGSAKDPKAGTGSLVYAITAAVIGASAIAAGVSLTAQESSACTIFFFFGSWLEGEGGAAWALIALTHSLALSLSPCVTNP
jgi:hypothetical protein